MHTARCWHRRHRHQRRHRHHRHKGATGDTAPSACSCRVAGFKGLYAQLMPRYPVARLRHFSGLCHAVQARKRAPRPGFTIVCALPHVSHGIGKKSFGKILYDVHVLSGAATGTSPAAGETCPVSKPSGSSTTVASLSETSCTIAMLLAKKHSYVKGAESAFQERFLQSGLFAPTRLKPPALQRNKQPLHQLRPWGSPSHLLDQKLQHTLQPVPLKRLLQQRLLHVRISKLRGSVTQLTKPTPNFRRQVCHNTSSKFKKRYDVGESQNLTPKFPQEMCRKT